MFVYNQLVIITNYKFTALIQYHFEENPKTKEILKKKAFEKLPLILGKLEEEVKKNGGHFVNGKVIDF